MRRALTATLATLIWWAALDIASSRPQGDNNPPYPQSAQQQTADQAAVEAETVGPAVAPTEPASDEHDSHPTSESPENGYEGDHLFLGDGWAQWVMAGTGVFALLLSAWAVWLLKGTLDATKQAVVDTGRAADAAHAANAILKQAYFDERRPWVTVSVPNIVPIRIEDGVVHAIVPYRLKNIGESPAFRVQIKIVLFDVADEQFSFDGFLDEQLTIKWPIAGYTIAMAGSACGSIATHTRIDNKIYEISTLNRIYVAACATYELQDRKTLGQSGICFQLTPVQKPDDFIPDDRADWQFFAKTTEHFLFGRMT